MDGHRDSMKETAKGQFFKNSFCFGLASRELGVRFGKFAIATGHHHKQKALRERKGKTRVRLARRYRPVPVPLRSAGEISRFAREWGTYHVISAPSRCRGRWGGGSEEGGGRGQKFWLAFRCCWFFACVFLVDRCKSRPHNAHQKWQRLARETLPIPPHHCSCRASIVYLLPPNAASDEWVLLLCFGWPRSSFCRFGARLNIIFSRRIFPKLNSDT